MNKIKKAFFCTNCGYESAKWTGKCPACNEWNSFTEEIIHKEQNKNRISWKEDTGNEKLMKSISLVDVEIQDEERLITPDGIKPCTGWGFSGSLILAAGEPGIGKSLCFYRMR
jgi:DNA repair protein RadA/Sms